MRKKHFCKILGNVEDVEDSCCMLTANMLKTSKVLKQAITDFNEFIYFLSKMCTNYNVDSDMESFNYSLI